LLRERAFSARTLSRPLRALLANDLDVRPVSCGLSASSQNGVGSVRACALSKGAMTPTSPANKVNANVAVARPVAERRVSERIADETALKFNANIKLSPTSDAMVQAAVTACAAHERLLWKEAVNHLG
jgi:hypothetical protein